MSVATHAPLLAVEDLTVRYGGVVAVDGVSFSIPHGSIVGLIGPNGAGKTSIVDALTGYTRPALGRVRFDGSEITGLPPHRIARSGIARTFQAGELFDDLTVRENLLAASDPRGTAALVRRLLLGGSDAERDSVAWALETTGLEDVAGRLPSELSYGRARLAGVARALATGPRLLLMDEPAAGLDTDETREVARRLRELPAHGLSVLLIDHDMSLVMSVCDTVIVIDFGRIICAGSPAVVRRDPSVIAAYLGTQRGGEEPVG